MAALLLVAVSAANEAGAQQSQRPLRTIELVGVLGYSDNPARLPPGREVDETLNLLHVRAGIEDTTSRLRKIIRSDLQYASYAKNHFEDENVSGVDMFLAYDIVPRRFVWSLTDNYGQQLRDPFRTLGPGNRENINYLTTGPQLTVPFAGRYFMVVSAQHSDVNYSESPLDNSRLSSQFGFGRRVSDTRSVSLIYQADDVEYAEASAGPDFKNEQAFFRFDSANARGTFQLDIGESALKSTDRDDAEPLVRLMFDRRVAQTLEMSVQVGRHFSDAGEAFRRFQGSEPDIGTSPDILGTGDPFLTQYASLHLTADRRRGSLYVGVTLSDEDYQNVTEANRRLSRIGFGATRQFTRLWRGIAQFDYERREFLEIDRTDNDRTLTLGIDRLVGPRLAVGGRALVYERRTNAIDAGAKENQIAFQASYTIGRDRTR